MNGILSRVFNESFLDSFVQLSVAESARMVFITRRVTEFTSLTSIRAALRMSKLT